MTNCEKRHLQRLSDMGCIACQVDGYSGSPAEVHHIRAGVGMSQRQSNMLAIPLCPDHHRHGTTQSKPSVHNARAMFNSRYGGELDLLDLVLHRLLCEG